MKRRHGNRDVLPRGGTWRYITTRSSVILLMVSGAGGREKSYYDLYQPFILCQASLEMGGCKARRASISTLDVSIWRQLYSFSLAVIWWLRCCRRPWLRAGSWRMETIMTTSLQMSSNIHTLFLDSLALVLDIARRSAVNSPSSPIGVVLGISRRRAENSQYSLFGVVGGRMGSCVRLPRHFDCALRVVLWRQPRIN